jgi:hypothetical protein
MEMPITSTNRMDRETEPDWDKDLGEDVKSECQQKYGKVEYIKIERESQVRCLQGSD